MLHCAQGGTGYGTMVNSAESAKFFEKQYGTLLEDIYSGFVTPDEARMLHDGRELYIQQKRLWNVLKSVLSLCKRRQKLMEDCDCDGCEEHLAEAVATQAVKPVPVKNKAPVKKASPKKVSRSMRMMTLTLKSLKLLRVLQR